MKIEHDATFGSLGSAIQMSIIKKNKDKADELLKNPRIKIVIELP